MPERKRHVYTLWCIASLALLAWMLVLPTRKSGAVVVSSRLDCRRSHFALSQVEPTTRVSAGVATDAVLDVNALASENEEEATVEALDKPRADFLIACPSRKASDCQLISPRSILSLYHLRC